MFISVCLQGQTGRLKISVSDGQKPMSGAHVQLLPSKHTGFCDSLGQFLVSGLHAGSYNVLVSYIGFKQYTSTIFRFSGKDTSLHILMQADVIRLNELVVSASLQKTAKRESIGQIDVVTRKQLENLPAPVSLSEAMNYVNGLQEVVACGVCGTNSISIHGLPGPYTAVMIDGVPLYGSLAGIYSLNGIPINMLEKTELVKGPASTLFGAEAMAGVVNVISRNTDSLHFLSADWQGTSNGQFTTGLVAGIPGKRSNKLLGLQHSLSYTYKDRNQDGFGDFVQYDRYSLFGKWENHKGHSLFVKYFFEDRRNGVEAFVRKRDYRLLQGNDSIYGESIQTQRIEALGNIPESTRLGFKTSYAFSLHKQHSFYGSDAYIAEQYTGFLQTVKHIHRKRLHLLTGASLRAQHYDDNTIATEILKADGIQNTPEQWLIPGLFVQGEYTLHKKLKWMGGARADYFPAHGCILSPRAGLGFIPSEKWTIRLNYGTGFRQVQLFSEEHAFISGQREVRISQKLKPERAQAVSSGIEHFFIVFGKPVNAELTGFYTHFTQKIIADYSQQGYIVYNNLSGYAVSKGIDAQVQINPDGMIALTAGANWQHVFSFTLDENGQSVSEALPYSTPYSGMLMLTVQASKKLQLSYTLRTFGPMNMPAVYDVDNYGNLQETHRPLQSPAYNMQHIQASYSFKNTCTAVMGIRNLFDVMQEISPLSANNDPNHAPGFSPHFDTSYMYAGLSGREVFIDLRWEIRQEKKKKMEKLE